MRSICLCLVLLFTTTLSYAQQGIPQQLKDASVLVDVGDGSGSGVIFKNGKNSFVWTDAHVIPKPNIKVVIDLKTNTTKALVSFKDVLVVQHDVENGRKVGQSSYLARVVRYSPEQDIALLFVYKQNYGKAGVKFFDGVPKEGDSVWHVGSIHGYMGLNTVSEGVIASTGRLRREIEPNEEDGFIYDQISGVAYKGSSGGGVFLKKSKLCVGLVTECLHPNGDSPGSYMITPARRLIGFAKIHKAAFAVDESVPVPDDDAYPAYVDVLVPPKSITLPLPTNLIPK